MAMGLCLENACKVIAAQTTETRRAPLAKLHVSHCCFLLLAIALRGSPFDLPASLTRASSRLKPLKLTRRASLDTRGHVEVLFWRRAPAHHIARRAGSLPRSRNRPTLKLLLASRPLINLHNGRAAEVYRCRRSGGLPARVPTIHEPAARRAGGSAAQPEPSDTEAASPKPTFHLAPQGQSSRGLSAQAERRVPCARSHELLIALAPPSRA
jgi:hypothetical protein